MTARPNPLTPELARGLLFALASKHHWTVDDVAHHCGVHPRTVRRWLTGQTAVDLSAILRCPPGFQQAFWAELFRVAELPLEVSRKEAA